MDGHTLGDNQRDMTLLKTDFLYANLLAPIKGGMVRITKNGTILEVGQQLDAGDSEVKYYPGALCPGFVNTHCHLELSHLKGKVKEKTELNGFIQELQSIREAENAVVKLAIEEADKEMEQEGILAIGDICNDAATFEFKQKSALFYHSFIELFSFDPEKANDAIAKGLEYKQQAEKLKHSASIVPHSPYSVSSPLFKLIAETENNSPLSIHNQETAAENELFQSASGKMAEMLQKFGFSADLIVAKNKNSIRSYLPMMPKDNPLLLVHNTYSTAADIAFAEKIHPNLFWCFCPNANLYIENKLPHIPDFIKEGVKCTLGTDSLASNHQLSILSEMKTIKKAFPEISTQKLIEWASKNGAAFLGLPNLGSFEKGKKPGIIWLQEMDNDQIGVNTKSSRLI